MGDIVYFSVMNAVSTVMQARLLQKYVESKGYGVVWKKNITPQIMKSEDVHSLFFFYLAFSREILDHSAFLLMGYKPYAIWITIEGLPKACWIRDTCLARLQFIAVSKFVRRCAVETGMPVVDVIHHAIDPKQTADAMRTAEPLRRRLKEQFHDKVLLCLNSRHDPRKALPVLAEALRILKEKGRDDFVVVAITEGTALQLFEGLPFRMVEAFGSIPYRDVLRLMAACDFLVHPAVCEGFGLPVLEANAVGRPAIHAWFPPLNEFSSQDFNFTFDYDNVRAVEDKAGQYWLFHVYPPEWLAETIEFAVDCYKHDHEQYQEYCARAREHAERNFDYRKVFRKFDKHLKL